MEIKRIINEIDIYELKFFVAQNIFRLSYYWKTFKISKRDLFV